MSVLSILNIGRSERMFKFLGVGVLNTLFGYSIYAGLVFVEIPYLVALLIATFVGVIFNYFSIGRLVFKAAGGWFVFGKFIMAYTIVYLLNAALLAHLTESEYLNAYLAQAACIFPSVAVSWLLMNHWVYKNGKEHE